MIVPSEDPSGGAGEPPGKARTSSFRLRVVPLGTSAGRPTLARGASALAIATEGAWVLCDCGEGAQLAALRAGLSFSRLDAVLITHLHGDHFNGLPGLLGTLGLEGRERPITVAGPRGIASLLETLARAGSLGVGGPPSATAFRCPTAPAPWTWRRRWRREFRAGLSSRR
jgi:glyoxylase-like metal-dependent hydrolase (beta-lactamase superfamily II)